MPSLTERLRILLRLTKEAEAPTVVVPLDDDSLCRLMHVLDHTRDDELSCAEVFSRLDEYVDCLYSHQSMGVVTTQIEYHLEMCPDCRDQLDALVLALRDAYDDPSV